MEGVFGRGIWIGRRSFIRRDWEFVEMDVGNGKRIPTLDTNLCLEVMSGRADVMNG